MRKIVLSLFFCGVSLIAFTQSKNIQNAYNAYNRQDRDGARIKMQEAKEFIDLAYSHESTSNDPKMWNYRSKIYLEIMTNHPYLDDNAVFKATESHIRCLDRDKKGRVIVRKWTREEDVIDGLIQCGYNLFNSGVEDYNNQEYNLAIEKYEEIFKILPLDKDNLLKRGNIVPESIYKNLYLAAFQLGDIDMQIEYLQKSIDLNTTDPQVYYFMSQIYIQKGNLEDALSYIQIGKELLDSDVLLINSEIDLLIMMGRSNVEIIEKLSEAIELDDLNEVLYVIRSKRYMDDGMYIESESDLNFIISEINPNSELAIEHFTELYNIQIMALEERVRNERLDREQENKINEKLKVLYGKTLPYLILYNQINPDSKAGLNNLATIYYKLGMEDESTETRKKLNSLH